MAIAVGLKELEELEQSEGLFNESDFDGSSESGSENDSKLSRSLEDINLELKKRADLTEKNSHSQAATTTTYERVFLFNLKKEKFLYSLEMIWKHHFVFDKNV